MSKARSRRSGVNQLRQDMYRGASILGDIEAIEEGPGAVVRRVVRKEAYKKTNVGLRKFLRGFGL